jgi:LDH2 family malate/lactate/ureidoglycolate dehydrogenase
MLERFHVPDNIAVRVKQEDMRATVEEIFQAMGMPEADAQQAADVLMYADIRGIESHGVSNMMRSYVANFKEGKINPTPRPQIIFEAPAVATLDSDRGHGLVIGPQAMQMAIERANTYGISAITVTNGVHFGAAAYHAAMALDYDMIGLAMTTGGVSVAPVYGAKAMVGLNPLAIAVPTKSEPPFIFDAAMSSVAGNKIRLAQRLGVNVLPGWIAEKDGTPIMDERPIPHDWIMLPLGGTREIGSHKGYSLAVMIEVLCSVLGNGGAGPFRRRGASHHFVAYKISAFCDLDTFKQDMDEYLRGLQETPTAPGHDRVVYAGLPEHEEAAKRLHKGIPYHPEVIEWFRGITAELGLPDRFS